MKYNSSNLPLQCMMTQSTCYRGTRKMTVLGVLWHSTGANNPTLKRYVQPDDNAKNRDELIKKIGKNVYGNDWNHIEHQAGLNCWIGKLADGSVTTVQTMPWDYRPWGCGSGSKGSCNNGWIQFEICEDGLSDKDYFNKVYKEACEITAYLCKMFNIDPNGTVTLNGVKVPTILCHADSHSLGLGSNHGDVNHWFPKFGKSMKTAREDVAKLIATSQPSVNVKSYKVVTSINRYSSAADAKSQKNSPGKYDPGTYYIYSKYPDGIDGMLNISKDSSGNSAGSWINPSENKKAEPVKKLYRVRISWEDAKSQIGAYSILSNAKATADANASQGYKVFDSSGKVVYIPEVKQPEKPSEQPEKPVETKPAKPTDPTPAEPIFSTSTDIIGYSDDGSCNKNRVKAIKKITSIYSEFDNKIADAFFEISPIYKIDPMMAISQSILETGWFRFNGSSVKPDQHNYCGLGATGGGVAGAAFDNIEDGVHAQCQHLYAYGCKDELPEGVTLVDPRFKYVTRGKSLTWEGLAGKWAVPGYDTTYSSMQEAIDAGATYGQKILKIRNQLLEQEVTDEEVEEYYNPTVEEPPVVETPEEPKEELPVPDDSQNTENPQEEPTEPNNNDKETQLNTIQSLLIKCIEAIISFIKSIFKK